MRGLVPSPDNQNQEKNMNAGNGKEVRRLIEIILKRGYKVTVQDEEEVVLRKSTDPEKIFSKLDTTSEDYLALWDAEQKKYVGTFVLIYCNAEDGSEVISDYTFNPVCEGIYREWDE